MQDKHFTLTGGSYRVHEAVLDNMVRFSYMAKLYNRAKSVTYPI